MSDVPLLAVDALTMRFGGVTALAEVTFEQRAGTILGLIGPNGAGKTTCFNCVTGLYAPTSGQVRLDGKPLPAGRPSEVPALGIARTFQNIRLFPSLSALENVMVGAHHRQRHDLVSALVGRHADREIAHECVELLAFCGLAEVTHRGASELPYGVKRKLEIARALAAHPRLLLLDEPAAGLNPNETQSLMHLLRLIQARGITILLIEHDMHLVMNLCEHIVVLDAGRLIAEGSAAQVRNDPRVIAAYLGGDPTAPLPAEEELA